MMDEKEKLELEETAEVEVTETDEVSTDIDEPTEDVEPMIDADGGEELEEAPAETDTVDSQTEEGKTILGPEDDMDRDLTDPDGMPAPQDINVDKQINDENIGFMDELAKKFEAGVKGDAELEAVHDNNVEAIISEIEKDLATQHAPENSEKDSEDPHSEELGGTDIENPSENTAANALNDRAEAAPRSEYSATGEPKELAEVIKEQNDMTDGEDLFGESGENTEIVNDKAEVMPSTYKGCPGNGIPEGNAEIVEDNSNTSELEANGDAENRSFTAGNSLTATEEEEDDFVPTTDDEEEDEEIEEESEEVEDEEDSEDDYEEMDSEDDVEETEEVQEENEWEDDENGEGSVVPSDAGDNTLQVTFEPESSKEVTSLTDVSGATGTAEIEDTKGLLSGNQEVSAVNTEEGNPEVPQMPGNNGNDMVEGTNYEDQGELDHDKVLSEIIGELDSYQTGMGIGDAENPTQFGDDAVKSEDMGDGQSYCAEDPYDLDAKDSCDEVVEADEPVEDFDAEDEVVEETTEMDVEEEATESLNSPDFDIWNW